jgi:putative peptide zinc metalloprotease protein
VLCRACRRQIDPRSGRCSACGRASGDEGRPGDLVLSDGRRIPVVGTVSIGRAPGNTLRLADPGVSRRHAIVDARAGDVVVRDAGSRAGTFVGERRVEGAASLRDGDLLRLGRTTVIYERRRGADEAGRTVVVAGDAPRGSAPGLRPRLRDGATLKRLGSPHERRWIVRDPGTGAALRMGDAEAALMGMLDGRHTMAELVAAAERHHGADGPVKLAQMLGALADRGLLERAIPGAEGGGRLARLTRPRDHVIPGAGRAMRVLYDHGGFLLFTRPARLLLCLVGALGLGTFVSLVVTAGPLPFRVADSYSLGALVFILARLALVAAHEVAHGLTLLSFGRPVRRAGLKLVLIFPYAFVDTSEAWHEPRRRRIAISAAGPVSDLVCGGACALAASALTGVSAEIAYQLALAAYLGAFYNLNPLLERDGYHILVDVLGEPNLRRRSRERLAGALSGTGGPDAGRRLVLGFAVAAWAWSVLGIAISGIAMAHSMEAVGSSVPPQVLWTLFGIGCAVLAVPALSVVVLPLARRRAGRRRRS